MLFIITTNTMLSKSKKYTVNVEKPVEGVLKRKFDYLYLKLLILEKMEKILLKIKVLIILTAVCFMFGTANL